MVLILKHQMLFKVFSYMLSDTHMKHGISTEGIIMQ